jgi:hypothetical protein
MTVIEVVNTEKIWLLAFVVVIGVEQSATHVI